MRVLIAGGGTGGHVIPALAIGREMRDEFGAEVRFVGTARGLETRLVPEAGFPLELIHVGQLKNVSLATRMRTLGDLPLGVARCLGLLRGFRPDLVVGVGGYASGPAMMAALLLRLPTLAYEPNAVPGLANRLVGRYVSAAAVSYHTDGAVLSQCDRDRGSGARGHLPRRAEANLDRPATPHYSGKPGREGLQRDLAANRRQPAGSSARADDSAPGRGSASRSYVGGLRGVGRGQ